MKSAEHTYSLSIERHEDGYLAYFPTLPGCHTWAATYEAAVRRAEEALIGYLEALQTSDQKLPVERPAGAGSLGVTVEIPTIV